jgi:hypothetical protein
MFQINFLSVLLNAASGFVLFRDAAGGDGEDGSQDTGFKFSPKNKTFRLVLGILTAVTGLLSLLASTDVPVVGDIIPALAGFATGGSLLFDYYKKTRTITVNADGMPDNTEKAIQAVDHYKKPVGIIGMAAAALHFLLPGVLLL